MYSFNELTKLYSDIDEKKRELDTFRPLTNQQIENFKFVYETDMTYNSNAIEGNTLSYSETKLILKQGITIPGKSVNEHLEVINHKDAIEFIEELIKIPTSKMTLNDVFDIHYLILKGINTKEAGKYRTRPLGVVNSKGEIYRFSEPLLVEDKMKDFIDWLENSNDVHPILRASEAHYRIVSIHPFIDGNGRTSRLVMNLILMQNGYVPAIIKNEDRNLYIQSIEKAQNGASLNEFYEIVANSVNKNFDFYLETLKSNMKFI